jgi:anti-sigma-K factor RskA
MAITPHNHAALRDQVELYVLDALTQPERTAFEAHLSTCEECRAQVDSLRPIVDSLSQIVPQHDAPAALRSRVLAAAAAAPARAFEPPLARPRRVVHAVIPWLAAAAMLVVAVGSAIYATTLRSRVNALERRLAEAIARAELNDRQVAELRRSAATAQSQVAVLAAPDLQRIVLTGQAVAPRSSGRAFWSRSQGLMFTASNLPPLPTGRTYQVWVLTRQPAPIGAGLFKPDAAGRVAEWFATPVDLPQPVGMAVTVEPDGGVPSPTGAMYLVGQ